MVRTKSRVDPGLLDTGFKFARVTGVTGGEGSGVEKEVGIGDLFLQMKTPK